MLPFNEQFSTAAKTSIEAQLSAFLALATKTFESVEKVVDLNMTAAKASLEDTAVTTKQLLNAKDPQEFFSLSAAQTQPAVAKAIAYGRHLTSIASTAQAEFTRTAEEQFAEAGRKVSEIVEGASKNAPAGSENVIALFKSAFNNANAGYEQFTKNTKQAVEVIETNLNTAVNQFSQVAEKAAAATTTRARTK